ncbi:MAG: NUDIX hydrolase [Parcubacteria group bacterium GW2011_GWA2_43_11]|nr:MAG: NUDIX hydrolase [Parcubacteria group bacterium GW2011_GWC2_42_11]KKS85677.1 MAG: NUDIX hydrolase [Parcubacteria group bacterium GW2011_GWA2_43_11]
MPKEIPIEYRTVVVAVDVVVFSVFDGALHVLLIPVNRPPHYVAMRGLPGGIMEKKETSDEAVLRHLSGKIGLSSIYFEQLYTFTSLGRDKRNRVASIAHLGLVTATEAKRVEREGGVWVPVHEVDKLAFDHNEILDTAVVRLAGKLLYTNIVRHLLPKKFTLTELQKVYEIIRNETFDKRNFRKKILSMNIIHDTGEMQTGVANRPASLYSFTGTKVTEIPLISVI